MLEGKGREVVHVTQANAKLALLSSRPHMAMMSISFAGVNADEDLLSTEQIGPVFKLRDERQMTGKSKDV